MLEEGKQCKMASFEEFGLVGVAYCLLHSINVVLGNRTSSMFAEGQGEGVVRCCFSYFMALVKRANDFLGGQLDGALFRNEVRVAMELADHSKRKALPPVGFEVKSLTCSYERVRGNTTSLPEGLLKSRATRQQRVAFLFLSVCSFFLKTP